MSKKKDLSGMVFGKLKVIEQYYENSKQNKRQWYCLCECGKEKIVTTCNLNGGQVKSCGCIVKSQIKKHYLPNGKASLNALFSRYKKRAIKLNIIFNLTFDDFVVLTKGKCFYCGIEPKQIIKEKGFNGEYIYNGIDRVDNSNGYCKENCVSCCGKCNKMKNSLSKYDFLTHIKKILFHLDNNDSRCGSINDVSGKRFVCSECGHKDHRDANASFNIGIRGKQSCGGITDNESELSAGLIDDSQTSKGEVRC